MAIRVIPHETAHAEAWNRFVAESRNGTFLLNRGYMDYHADRFSDASLLFEDDGKLVAVFPANHSEGVLASHAGLTYGGLILGEATGAVEALALFDALLAAARSNGFRQILYKTVPSIFHRSLCEEDRYALFRIGARLIRRDAWSALAPTDAFGPSPMRARRLRRASSAEDVRVGPSQAWAGFWEILAERLQERHAVAPTHSLDEITLLAQRFPQNIQLIAAERGGRVLAGAVLYDCGVCMHGQYFAASADGRRESLLDLVIAQALDAARARGQTFSFGASTEEGGQRLNEGLAQYKESFGARCVVHDFYEIDV